VYQQLVPLLSKLIYIPNKINAACAEYLTTSLFMLGKFGDNDYLYMLSSGKSIDFVNSTITLVVDIIISAAEVST
jgi:hypothetical protein